MKELKNVVIYTKDHCPFSKRVKEYLTSEKVDFKQIRVDDDPKTYDELKKKTNLQTVPQVFVDGKFIGSATVSIHRNSIDTGKMRRSSLDPTFLLA